MRKLIWTEKNNAGLCINNPVRPGNKHMLDISEQVKQQGNLNWLFLISSVTSMQRDNKEQERKSKNDISECLSASTIFWSLRFV